MAVQMNTSAPAASTTAETPESGTPQNVSTARANRKTPQQMQAELKAKREARNKKAAEEDAATSKGLDTAAGAVDTVGGTANSFVSGSNGKSDAAAAIVEASGHLGDTPVPEGTPDPSIATTTAPTDGASGAGGIGAAIGAITTAVKIGLKIASTAKKVEAAQQSGADGLAIGMTVGTEALGMATDAASAKKEGKAAAELAYEGAYKKEVGQYNGLNGEIKGLEEQQAALNPKTDADKIAALGIKIDNKTEKRDAVVARAGKTTAQAEAREAKKAAKKDETTPDPTAGPGEERVTTAGQLGRQSEGRVVG